MADLIFRNVVSLYIAVAMYFIVRKEVGVKEGSEDAEA